MTWNVGDSPPISRCGRATYQPLDTLSIVFGWAARAGSPWRLANLAPVAGLLFDYLENIATSLVIGRFPQRTPVVDWLAPLFTALKWLFVNGSFVLLVGGALIAGWRWLRARS